MILRVQTSRERHRIRDRRSALCIYRVVLRASPFKSHQGLRLHRAQLELRLNAFRLKHERQHRSVMSEEEEEEEEEEGIHYVEKTLFYWFSVREMANVLRDNLASIKTPYCPLRCDYSHALRASHNYYRALQTRISHVHNIRSCRESWLSIWRWQRWHWDVRNAFIDRGGEIVREMETEEERNKTKVSAAPDFRKIRSYYDCTSHYNAILQ